MIRLRRVLALLAGLLALVGLLVGTRAAAQFRNAVYERPWFAGPTQVALGADGALYVGLGAREVQVYDREGKPQSAWIPEGDPPFRLRGDAGGGVAVVRADDRVVPYDAEGKPGAPRTVDGAWQAVGAPRTEVVAPDGMRYALRDEGLVREGAGGARLLVPAPPVPLAWFGLRPLLPITLLLLGSLLAIVVCIGLVATGRRPEAPGAPRAEGA